MCGICRRRLKGPRTKTGKLRMMLWEKTRMPSGVFVLSKLNRPFSKGSDPADPDAAAQLARFSLANRLAQFKRNKALARGGSQ